MPFLNPTASAGPGIRTHFRKRTGGMRRGGSLHKGHRDPQCQWKGKSEAPLYIKNWGFLYGFCFPTNSMIPINLAHWLQLLQTSLCLTQIRLQTWDMWDSRAPSVLWVASQYYLLALHLVIMIWKSPHCAEASKKYHVWKNHLTDTKVFLSIHNHLLTRY